VLALRLALGGHPFSGWKAHELTRGPRSRMLRERFRHIEKIFVLYFLLAILWMIIFYALVVVIGAVVVAACTRTVRGLQSELHLGPADGMPEPCVANFDDIHTVRRAALRRRITRLASERMDEACTVLCRALGCV
jgi:mRNA interferase MazF